MYLATFAIEILILYLLSRKVRNKLWYLIGRVFRNGKVRIILYSLFFMPGTVFHELSHFLAAIILFVPVKSASFMPVYEDNNKLRMGQVVVAKKDFLRSAIVSVAPIFIGISSLIYLGKWLLNYNSLDWYIIGAILFFVFQISNSMYLSQEDVKNTYPALLVILLTLVLCIFLSAYLDVNVLGAIMKVDMYVGSIVYFLVIPIIINILVILLS